MPRTKVKPQDRERVTQACQSCRASKRRCDGSRPCRVCIRRKRAHSCTYAPSASTSTPERPSRSVPNAQALSVPSVREQSGDACSSGQRQIPSGRLLRDNHGEHVYVNSLSGLSLLQFMKLTLRNHMRASRFTDGPDVDTILDDPEQSAPIMPSEVNSDRKRQLLHSFFVASCGVLDIYSEHELSLYLEDDSLGRCHPESLQSAAVNLAVAIGAQSQSLEKNDMQIAAAGYRIARHAAFKNQLESVSVDLVRVFLLMAFYTIGACRRHAATMHIGVAATAATMLGLHDTAQYAKLPEHIRSVRWRTYRALFVMDVTAATLLGRPILTPQLTSGKPLLGHDPRERQLKSESAICASFDICSMIHAEIVHGGQDIILKPSKAVLIIEKLERWAVEWKKEQPMLRSSRATFSDPSTHAPVAGNLHASCIYYHALITATRSSLVDALTDQIAGSSASLNPETEAEHARLQQVCIEAAMSAAHTCQDAYRGGWLMKNQCHIIRPVLFEVGITLGFVMTTHIEGSLHVEDAFRKARKVLKYLAETSSLAKSFYDMLTSLLNAVMVQRMEKSRESRSGTFPAVTRLAEFSDEAAPVASGAHRSDLLPSLLDDALVQDSVAIETDTDLDPAFLSEEWSVFADVFSEFLPTGPDSVDFPFENI